MDVANIIKMNKKIIYSVAFISLFCLANFVLAADDALDPNTVITNVLTMIMWPVFAGVIVIMLLYAGIMFAIAEGDPTKITKAKAAVIYAVVGIFIGILAYSATNIIKGVLGVT